MTWIVYVTDVTGNVCGTFFGVPLYPCDKRIKQRTGKGLQLIIEFHTLVSSVIGAQQIVCDAAQQHITHAALEQYLNKVLILFKKAETVEQIPVVVEAKLRSGMQVHFPALVFVEFQNIL